MTSTMKPFETKERPDAKLEAPVEFGTKADLLRARPLRTKDVVVLGKTYRVRELKLGEAEEIQHLMITNEMDGKGGITGKADIRGSMARRVACGLQLQDGSPYFAKPFEEYKQLLELPADMLTPLDKAITELSALSEGAREELGKDSGRTPSVSG